MMIVIILLTVLLAGYFLYQWIYWSRLYFRTFGVKTQEIDINILPLVQSLNAAGFIRTHSSCAGHFDLPLRPSEYRGVANVMFETTNREKFMKLAQRLAGLHYRSLFQKTISFEIAERFFFDGEFQSGFVFWIYPLDRSADGDEKRSLTDSFISFLTNEIKKFNINVMNECMNDDQLLPAEKFHPLAIVLNEAHNGSSGSCTENIDSTPLS